MPADNEVNQPSAALLIHCAPSEFGEFIAGLLGKPHVVSQVFRGNFSITTDEIVTFNDLIEQRIAEQNTGTLIECVIKTNYTDGSSVEVSSISQFKTYAETRSVVPERINMTWVYVIFFQGKTVPERQQVELEIEAKKDYGKWRDSEGARVSLIDRDFVQDNRGHSGRIFLSISHTSRSWGLDIFGLMTNQINIVLKDDSNSLFGWIRRSRFWIGVISFIATILIALTSCIVLLRRFQEPLLRKYNAIRGANSITTESLAKRLDFLFSNASIVRTTVTTTATVLYLFLAIIFAGSVTAGIMSWTEVRAPSSILLTKRAIDNQRLALRNIRLSLMIFLLTFTLNVLASLVASVIFIELWPKT